MIIFTYPGQGSQSQGMGTAWQNHPSWELVEEASDISGRDIAQLLCQADDDTLRQTRNSQLATFVTSMVALDALTLVGIAPSAHAGHSLGEYSALAASGVLSFADATALVAERGEAMQSAAEEQDGTMAAVLGLDDDEVEAACESAQGDVWVANYNAIGQVVIAGAPDLVTAAGAAAKARGAKRIMPLPVGGAFHTPYMASAAERLEKAISQVEFRAPDFPVYANVDAAARHSADDWPQLLGQQLTSPVRWRHQIQNIIADGGDSFVEIGPGRALTATIKRIDKSVEIFQLNTPDDIDVLLKSIGPATAPEGEQLYVHERIVVSPAAGLFQPAPDLSEGSQISVGTVIGTISTGVGASANASAEAAGSAGAAGAAGAAGTATQEEVYSPFEGEIMGFLAYDTERVFANQPLAWLRTQDI